MHKNTPYQVKKIIFSGKGPSCHPESFPSGEELTLSHPTSCPIKPSGYEPASPQNSSQIYTTATTGNLLVPVFPPRINLPLTLMGDQYNGGKPAFNIQDFLIR